MNSKQWGREVPVITVQGVDRILHKIVTPSSVETIHIQQGELVGYEGEDGGRARSSARIAVMAYYRRGSLVRCVMHYAVQSFGFSVIAVLLVTYEEAGLVNGAMPIARIRGGRPGALAPVVVPQGFDGSMVLNDARLTVPPVISPGGDKYVVTVAMGHTMCSFQVPRKLGVIPAAMEFMSSVPMADAMGELTAATVKATSAGTKSNDKTNKAHEARK